jgi:hypothetical protein
MSDVLAADIQLVHLLPGRMRVHLTGFAQRTLECVETEMRGLRGISRVRFDPATSNLLVHFDPAQIDERAALTHLRSLLLPNTLPVADSPPPQKHSAYSSSGKPARHLTQAPLLTQATPPSPYVCSICSSVQITRVAIPPVKAPTFGLYVRTLVDAFGVQLVTTLIQTLLPELRFVSLLARLVVGLGLLGTSATRVAPVYEHRSGKYQAFQTIVSCIALFV